jgi:hypothetical protein
MTNQCWALLWAARYPFIAWIVLVSIAAAIIGWRGRSVRAHV